MRSHHALAAHIAAVMAVVGCSADVATDTAEPDQLPPTWPDDATLRVTAIGAVKVLEWPHARDDRAVAAYSVEVGGVERHRLAAGITTTELTAVGSTVGIVALDAAGNRSAALETILGAGDGLAPTWPEDATLRVTVIGEDTAAIAFPSASDADAPVDYRVWFQPAVGESGEPGELRTGGARSATLTGLRPLTTYLVSVRAEDTSGTISPSGPSAVFRTRDLTSPVWPAGATLVSTDLGDGALLLAWPGASDAGAVTYRVLRDGVRVSDTSERSATIAGLTPGKTVALSVVAIDATGNLSASLALVVDVGDEDPPTWPAMASLLASNVLDRSLRLAWPAAGVGVTGYAVTRDGVPIAETAERTWADEGLAPATRYDYEVRARDAAGNRSEPLSLSVTTPDLTAPSWPAGAAPTWSVVTSTSATLNFPAATDDVGVTGYRVTVADVVRCEGLELACTLTGLAPWSQVHATVYALDAAGNVSAEALSASIQTPDPSAPTWPGGAILMASELTPDSAVLTWTLATDDVGVVSYRLTVGDAVNDLPVADLDVSAAGTVSVLVSGLEPWTDVAARVEAVDGAGQWSSGGPVTSFRTPDDTPPVFAPGAIVGIEVHVGGAITVSWPVATDDGLLQTYEVRVDGGVVETVGPGVLTTLLTGLTPGQTLLVQVVARDAAGNGSAAIGASVFLPDGGAPAWPAGATLSAVAGDGQVTLGWPAAADDVAVSGYRVSRDGVVLATVQETQYVALGLPPGESVSFAVVALDASGNASAALETVAAAALGDDLGMRRLSEEQYNRAFSDVVGGLWSEAHARAGQTVPPEWNVTPDSLYADMTTRTWSYWRDYRLGYPSDVQTPGPGEPRGGYRRLDQTVYDEHVTSWIGASLAIGAEIEGWVGHVVFFSACFAEEAAGLTSFDTNAEVIDHCVDDLIDRLGRRAFRRELTAEEHADLRAVYDDTETAYPGATYTHWAGYGWRARGLRNLFAVVLNSPEFLYRVEVGDDAGALTAFELATRLSFHFWNTVPDAELLDAAANGSLLEDAGYAAQVERLASDPRANRVIEEFYQDFFRVQNLPDVNSQDGPTSYHGGPTYNAYNGRTSSIREAMQDELTNLGRWFTQTAPGTYDDMFRSNLHFLECQRAPWDPESCYGAGPYSEWSYGFDSEAGWDGVSEPVTLPEPERAGLLTRLALLAHDTAYARPIRRGLYIREALLCDPVPPPENCDVVKPPEIDVSMTVREKVAAITEQPGTSCAGCHATFINGFGHALGHFSSKGDYWERERMFSDQQNAQGEYWYFLLPPEQWAEIDTHATTWLGGQLVTVNGPADVVDALTASGQLEWCWAREYLRFALGRVEASREDATVEALADDMRQGMTLDQAFRAVSFLPEFRALNKPITTTGGTP